MKGNSCSYLATRLCDVALDLSLIATIWMALVILARVAQERDNLFALPVYP